MEGVTYEVLAEQPPVIEIIEGWMFMKLATLRAGTIIPQHDHEHAHMTALFAGSMRVRIDGADAGMRRAPCIIPIAAGTMHEFTAIEDGTAFACVHRLEGDDIYPPIRAEHNLLKGT